MKRIFYLLIFFIIPYIQAAYKLKFYNKTDYLLQAVIMFDPATKCKQMTTMLRPQSPDQVPVEIPIECCSEVIKITNMNPGILNRITYDYQQQKMDDGLCSDAVITITPLSNGLLDVQ